MSASAYKDDPCQDGHIGLAEWQYDGNGLVLCKTCPKCHAYRMAQYRPEILAGYTQADVDEPIEPD